MSYFNRKLSTAAFALFALASASAAHADVFFDNITHQPVVFTISCDGAGSDAYTVAPGGQQALYCNNGSAAAVVEIRTDRGDGSDDVVDATVWDGGRYELGYDDDGDVNIEGI